MGLVIHTGFKPVTSWRCFASILRDFVGELSEVKEVVGLARAER